MWNFTGNYNIGNGGWPGEWPGQVTGQLLYYSSVPTLHPSSNQQMLVSSNASKQSSASLSSIDHWTVRMHKRTIFLPLISSRPCGCWRRHGRVSSSQQSLTAGDTQASSHQMMKRHPIVETKLLSLMLNLRFKRQPMPYNNWTALWAAGLATDTSCQSHILSLTSRSCSQNQMALNGLKRMYQNMNCSKWCVNQKYHSILHTNTPFSCMKRMKLKMSLQVWVYKSHHWKHHSVQLKLSTLWLCSILMSPNFLTFFILFQMSDHTSKCNNVAHSRAQKSLLTFEMWKPKKRRHQIVRLTVERWL